jgi:hypothetical protein
MMFGLHNMKCLDKGMELVITGVTEALADKVSFL